jgi:DNA-binding PadR family transcriptional regulator
MSLKHGLLGFLSFGPRTGYELGKMFFDPIQPSLSAIYRKLTEMTDEGLVDFERVDQEKLPDKNVFHITPAGRAELERWLRQPLRLIPPRPSVLMQLWFGSRVDKEDIIADIEAYVEQVEKVIGYFNTEARALVEKGLEESARPLDRLYWGLVVDCVIKQFECVVEWAEVAKRQISNFKPVTIHGRTHAGKGAIRSDFPSQKEAKIRQKK